MKSRAVLPLLLFIISILPFQGHAQSCNYNNILSDFQKDQLCSPVEVIKWEVSYTEVDDGGAPVSIHFDWDDGVTETILASEGVAGTFSVIATHTYVSIDDRCNYHAVATLVVNGVKCTSSPVEVVVTVWDVDNENGAYVSASPDVFPVCIGEGASMQFSDNTLYNCVPPQENDKPNISTRWIQWVYGTNHTAGNFMSSDVSVDGYTGPWPYVYPPVPKELPDGSTGSSEKSLPISVANDNLMGEEFQVELRYWNYCNKYTDGKPPVIDRSVIRIVGLPDATIDEVAPLCEFNASITLSAATGGGTWSGPGITDGSAGTFSPATAGPGIHMIHYAVTDGNSCSAEDDVSIVIYDAPDGSITPVDPVCYGDEPFNLSAASTPGTWNGPGITNNTNGTFSSFVAGIGSHEITYKTATDTSGCFGTDTSLIHVVAPPFATFLTPDSSWCQQSSNGSIATIVFTGIDTSIFNLVYETRGFIDTLFNMSIDTFDLFLNNLPGENLYILIKVIEYHGNSFCETLLYDTLSMTIHTNPTVTFATDDEYCSPAEVNFETTGGLDTYLWDFGDGESNLTSDSSVTHTYTFDYADNFDIIGGDTIYDLDRHDTVFYISLHAETNFGCEGYFEDSITVYPSPTANFHVSPVLQYHPDSVVNLINFTSVGSWEFLWNFGDMTSSELEEPGEHVYGFWGEYDIHLKVFSAFCSDTISKAIQIMPPPPVAGFEPDTSGCPPLSITFFNHSQYSDTYIWDFDDGKFSSDQNPTHTFYDSREHTVRLASIGPSGSDTTEQSILVFERPQAIFDSYPKESRNLKQIFKFSNNSVKGSYYLWDFGDGSTSAEEEPSHVYEDSGTYSVTLYVWSDQNCADTAIHENMITVLAGEGSVVFPTAFVWNGTGPTGGHWTEGQIDNSVFHPAVVNAKTFRMVIFTRWGEQVFESTDLYIGWDGYMRGEQLALEGVYIWKAWIQYVDGFEEIQVGDITFFH